MKDRIEQGGIGLGRMTYDNSITYNGSESHGFRGTMPSSHSLLKPPKVEIEGGLHSRKRLKQNDGQQATQVSGLEGMGASVTKTSALLSFTYPTNQPQLKKEPALHTQHSSLKQFYVNPLEEPSPLGLSLKKSPSLLDLIQGKLIQNPEGIKQDQELNMEGEGCVILSCAEKDKLKAANFPISLLKIGTWECSSRYEGDLVAKCYYAKRKLVWEVLEGGLKSKMEIQWSDITALKASCPENHKGSFDIEISRPPLFFKETDPQPRKHTSWQSSSDFTKGQATMCRHHYLEFPEGVFNRHFEKLIQCDLRLKGLSEKITTIGDSTFFDPHSLQLGLQKKERLFNSTLPHPTNGHSVALKGLEGEMIPHVNGNLCSFVEDSSTILQMPSLKRSIGAFIPHAASPSSVIDVGVEESASIDAEERFPREDAFPPLVGNVVGECTSEKRILDEISLLLLGEPYAVSNAHECEMIRRIGVASNTVSPVLTQELNPTITTMLTQVPTTNLSPMVVPLDLHVQANGPIVGHGLQLPRENMWSVDSYSSLDHSSESEICLPPSGSSGDLLYLPRVTSLPQFFIPSRNSVQE